MNKSLKRFLLVFAILGVFVCGALFAFGCTTDETDGKITYSVTVTTDDSGLDLTTVKAQWMNGEEEAGEAVALTADGKASAELDPGEYSVVLSGYDAGKYEYQAASVTAASPNANIALNVKKHTVTVTVTATGAELPANVAVQLYNGTTAVGASVTLTNTANTYMASLSVPMGVTGYKVGLVNIPDYLAWGEAKDVTDSTSSLAFEATLAEVEYSVTVSLEDGQDADLADLTVTFYQGEDAVEGATAVALVSGVATVNLTAGEYTVKIDNLDPRYEYEAATVSMTERTITISATKIIYTLTLAEDIPANVPQDQLASLTAQLVKDGEEVGEATAFVDGVAKINAPADTYSVVFGGATGIDGICANLTAESREATVSLGGKYGSSVSASGVYIVSVPTGAVTITLSYPTGGEGSLLYVATWQVPGSSVGVHVSSSDAGVNTAIAEEVSAILSSGSTTFNLTRDTEDIQKFILNLEVKAAPAAGEIYNPIDVEDVVGTYALPEGSEATEAYFRIPTLFNETQYTVTVPEGVEVYFLNNALVKDPGDQYKVTDGASITPATFDYSIPSTRNTYFYAKVVTDGTELTFSVAKFIYPGETPEKPIELTKGTEVTHKFPIGSYDDVWQTYTGPDVWFSFTPAVAGDYRFAQVTTFDGFNYTIFEGYEFDDLNLFGGGYYGTDQVEVSETGRATLEAEKTYYIQVMFMNNTEITVVINDYVAQPGEKDNPIEVSETGETPNTVSITMLGTDMYFKHTITADSLNAEGNFVLEFSPHPSSLRSVFYTDAAYTQSVGTTLGWDSEEYSITIPDLNVGDVIYFTISTYSETATFFINKPAEEGLVLKLDTPVSRPGTPPGPYDMYFEDVFTLVDIPAGDYEVTLVFNPETYGTVTIAAGSNSANITAPAGSYSIGTGTATITIAEGVTTLTVRVDGIGFDTPYTISIAKSVPKLDVGENQTFDLTTSTTEINVVAPAGTYTLEYNFSVMGMFGFSGGNVNNATFQQTGSTEITFEEGDVITITNYMGVDGVTVTFTLTAVGGDEGIELTVGTPVEVTLTPDASNAANLVLKLNNVPAGTYQIDIVTESTIFFFESWYVVVGETQVAFADSRNGYKGPVEITIPDDCTEISIVGGSFVNPFTATVTLTAVGGTGPVEPEEGDIVVGTGKQVELTADSWGISNEMTVYLEAGKTYQVSLTVPEGKTVYVNDINGKTNATGDHLYTSGGQPAQFTVTESGLVELKVVDSEMAGGFSVTILIEEVGGSSGPVGPQEPTVDVNEEELVIGEELTVTIVAGHTLQINFASAPQEGFYRITLSGAAVGNGGEYTVYSIIFGELDTNGDVLTAMNNYSSEWLSFGGSEEFIQINCTGLTDVTITITIELLEA